MINVIFEYIMFSAAGSRNQYVEERNEERGTVMNALKVRHPLNETRSPEKEIKNFNEKNP